MEGKTAGPSFSVEYQHLLQAISNCTAPIVHQLVRQYPSVVNQKGWNGQTPLHRACLGGDWTINYLLVEAGADPNAINDSEESPLHYACKRGAVSVVHLLIQHGGKLEALDKFGRGLMHHAAQTSSVLVLHYLSASHGLTFRDLDKSLMSPLHVCCQHGCTDISLRYLIRKERSDIFQRNSLGNTPIHISSQQGNAFITWLLMIVGGFQLLHMENKEGQTPLDMAKAGKSLGHKELSAALEYYYKFPKDQSPSGPVWTWYWYMVMPALLYTLTIALAHIIGSPYQGFVFLAGLGYILFLLRSHSHRLYHISRWPNPVYAGAFGAGILHTFIIYVWQILPNNLQYHIVTFPSVTLATVTVYMYFQLLRLDPGVTRSSIFKNHSTEEYTILDLCGPPTKLEMFCPECEIVHALRTKHCRLCERCYEEMDHHCLFLMKCIAKNNHRRFVWFLILLTLSMAVFVANASLYCFQLYDKRTTTDVFGDLFNTNAWLLCMMLLNIFSFLWGVNLIQFQVRLVSLGLTTFFRPTSVETVLTTTERVLNVVYFLQGKPFFAKDPLFDV